MTVVVKTDNVMNDIQEKDCDKEKNWLYRIFVGEYLV